MWVVVEDLDAKQNNLVILNNIVLEKNQRDFINLYVHERHRNISSVYCFLLFNLNKKERRMIATSCSDLEPDEFNSMFEGLPRYNFVMIDNQPVGPELKYQTFFFNSL